MRFSKILFQEKSNFASALRNNFFKAVQDPRYIKAVDVLRHNFKKAVEDPRYIKAIETVSSKIDSLKVKESVYKNIISINKWYTKILGLDELKYFQDRVVLLQEKLLVTQEKRREIGAQLAELRKKSYQLQDEIQSIKRQEDPDKYFRLMKEETELMKLDLEVNMSYQEYDKAERELFTAYSNAVRDSHEKYRAQMEYTKYLGIILSLAGSFLAFAYTSLKKNDLKIFIEKKFDQIYPNLNPPFNQRLLEESLSTQLRNDFNLYTRQNYSKPITPQNQEVDVAKIILLSGVGILFIGFILNKLT